MDAAACYAELGLTPESSDAELKAAWRRLSARWHPDRNDSPQALRKIQRINRALEEIRRLRSGEPEAGEEPEGASAEPADAPLEHELELSLEQALFGTVLDLAGAATRACADCAATGRRRVAGACPACDGHGRQRQSLWFGWMATEVDCPTCAGSGAAEVDCASCDGRGSTVHRYRRRVAFPPGVRAGDRLQVPAGRGQGQPGLSVHIGLQAHEFFDLDADGTLRCELPVDGYAWMAERWIEVPTPDGLQQMRLRRGHLAYRLRGLGFPAERRGARADCVVHVVPQFPETLTEHQEALVDGLVDSNTGAPDGAAATCMAAWLDTLARWQARREESAAS